MGVLKIIRKNIEKSGNKNVPIDIKPYKPIKDKI